MSTEVTIDRLGHLGDGIAPGPIFVARTLPGEVVSGEVDGDRLTGPRIVTPSGDRIKPACPHYNGCGGCQVMHASDSFVAAWKRGIVVDALKAHGIDADVLMPEPSPPHSRRRATFSVRRTKKGALAGFHGRASDVITAVPGCRVVTPALAQSLPMIEELARIAGSRKGELSVTVTESLAGLDVACTGAKPLDGPLRAELGQFVARAGLARLTLDEELVAMAEPPAQSFGAARVVPPPGAFLQATLHGERTLVRAVEEITSGARRIVDLFAGCGTFALPLAQGAEVHAVEGSGAMIDALLKGWRGAQGLKAVTGEARDLFRRPLMADELAGFDAVVIDPPRAGAAEQVAHLAGAQVPVIAHVSCNPATFARDAATLISAGYRMGPVRVIDQFRWSVHVEVAAGFTLA